MNITRHRSPILSAAAVTLLAGSAFAQPAEKPVRYDGHKSVRVTVTTPRQLMTVHALADDVLSCEGSGIASRLPRC